MRITNRGATGALAAFSLLGSLSGCALAGTDSHPPTLADLGVADHYSDRTAPGKPLDATVLDQWWRQLGDPLLDSLIEQGQSDNLDVRTAAGASPDPAGAAGKPATPAAEAKRIAVAAEIARTYVMLRGRQAMIANVQAFLAAQQDNIQVARFREEAKLVTSLDALKVSAESDRVAAMIPGLEAEVSARIARIAVLTGQAPSMLRDKLATPAPIPVGPEDIDIGTPSDLIARRPDVDAAAARLKRHAPWNGTSQGALSAYKQAVLLAMEDVEKARAAFAAAKARESGLGKAAGTAEQVTLLARKQYRDGLTDYTTLKDAEQALLSARNELAEGTASRARAVIDLWVTLDGGGSGDEHGQRS